jgi:hypothetical protein
MHKMSMIREILHMPSARFFTYILTSTNLANPLFKDYTEN